eukprot:Gb_30575 [translate_table: standard]
MIVSLLSFSLCPWVATTARLDGSAHAGRWAVREYARPCTSIQACPHPIRTCSLGHLQCYHRACVLLSIPLPTRACFGRVTFLFPSIAHDRIPPLVFSLSMGCNDGSFGW